MSTKTTGLSRELARRIAEGDLELPPMPATAAEVMALCQQESTDAARLSAAVHKDQTIASNVLRVANSAAYAGQVPCASLQQAVSRLGMQLITEIAVAVAVRGRVFADARNAALLDGLWKHSVLTGFFTKEIARLRRRNVEIAFLCGLLHDVGKAVLVAAVEDDRAATAGHAPDAELRDALDEQHVAAGVHLAEQWQLPDQVKEAIACHHQPSAATKFSDMARSVCLADLLSHHVAPAPGGPRVAEDELRSHDVLVGLNLYRDQLDALLGMQERALEVTEGLR